MMTDAEVQYEQARKWREEANRIYARAEGLHSKQPVISWASVVIGVCIGAWLRWLV